jgi:hypothetical protein
MVKKNFAYEHLTTKFKEIDSDGNKERDVKKINFSRSCFRNELTKENDWCSGRRYIQTDLVVFPTTVISYRPGISKTGHR